MKIVPKRH